MKSVSGGRAITRQAYQFSVFGFGGVAFGLFLIVLGAFLSRVPLAAPGSADAATLQTIVSTAQVIGVIAVILGIAAIVRGVTFKRESPLIERVAAVLAGAFGDEYVFFSRPEHAAARLYRRSAGRPARRARVFVS